MYAGTSSSLSPSSPPVGGGLITLAIWVGLGYLVYRYVAKRNKVKKAIAEMGREQYDRIQKYTAMMSGNTGSVGSRLKALFSGSPEDSAQVSSTASNTNQSREVVAQ